MTKNVMIDYYDSGWNFQFGRNGSNPDLSKPDFVIFNVIKHVEIRLRKIIIITGSDCGRQDLFHQPEVLFELD